jgi:hypothetical protein
MGDSSLTTEDIALLEKRGIPASEAERQLGLLREPPRSIRLNRACKLDDGIVQLSSNEQTECLKLGKRCASEKRLTKFVPASGAASRMFKDLAAGAALGKDLTASAIASQAEHDPVAKQLMLFWENREEFGFYDQLVSKLPSPVSDDIRLWITTLLDTNGLNYSNLPKGLVKFHAYTDHSRCAFEEHLAEGVAMALADDKSCRIHFTVSPQWRSEIANTLDQFAKKHFSKTRFKITYSEQAESTDTLAVDQHHRPIRSSGGELLLRPGGHGALINNLNSLAGDIVCIKNIDNIEPEWRRSDSVRWQNILTGYLTRLQLKLFEYAADLENDCKLLPQARQFMQQAFFNQNASSLSKSAMIDIVNRPIRVCGMVRNQGEPGGGPFWVESDIGNSMQIVEGAQIDQSDEGQRQIFNSSTHFNPVNLVCGLRSHHQALFDLNEFVDEQAVFIANKHQDGIDLKALERPGLWNGAMAKWNTTFVEIPLITFNPVKTVFDLLREGHRSQT